MESKWNKERENLERMILIDKISYELIGRHYGCTGSNIKKVAKRLGIELPERRAINPCETFNKGKKEYFCLNCGKKLTTSGKYCDSKCLTEYQYKQYIIKWKKGEESGIKGRYDVSNYIRRYLFEKYNNKCQKCGWGEINKSTNKIPLQIHHIDGNCLNNSEDNLQLLCPNCHSLTDTFGNLNSNSSRIYRKQKENV